MLSSQADATFTPLPREERSHLGDVERALARVPVAVWLGAIVTVSALFRFWVARSSPTPWIMPDEYIYSELSRSIGETGHFAVNGAGMATWSYGPLYPLLIAPAWLVASSAAGAYAAIQLINSLVMSTAAVFAYLLGRRVLDRQLAFFLAVLTVLVPSMVYSSKAMTESLAYPVFLAAVLAIVLALEQPTRSRQAVALLAIGLAVLTRAELVMLAPAFLTAVVLVAALNGEGTFRERLFTYRVTLGFFGFALAAGLAWSLTRGGEVLGAHGNWLRVFEVETLPRWFLTYIGELDLYVGIAPFAAFLLMLSLARQKTLTRAENALLAVAASSFLWLVLLVASYSTQPRPYPIVNDRYLFYVVPLELAVFLLWIGKGMPRPRRVAVIAALVALAAPAAIPFSEFLNGREWSVSSSTVALVPWGLLKPVLGAHGHLLAVILVIGAVGAAAFLTVSARRNAILRFLVLLNFLFITLFVLAGNSVVAQKAKEQWVAPTPDWIDAAVESGSPVVGVWALPAGQPRVTENVWGRWNALLEAQLANDTVVRTYAFEEGYDIVSPTRPFVGDAVAGADGRLLESGAPISAEYVVVGPELRIRGAFVARDPNSGLALYRIDGALTLR
jgi:dolichyl-phosphate-mannose-protein mannosyltransferase